MVAEDVLGEVRQLEQDIDGPPDVPLSPLDEEFVARSVESIRPLLLELQLASIPPGRTGVGADQSYGLLRRFRRPIRDLQGVLRRELDDPDP